MINKRHESIGIKQTIRFEWMQKTTNLLLAGLDAKAIRHELHEFLSTRNGNGSNGNRSKQTRTFVVTNLMKIWVSPAPELVPFRDASLAFLRTHPSTSVIIHWGVISAAYPFWFNVAKQTGRLLALQSQVTQTQIVNRLKEQYGDRQTVSRYARFVIRSLVAWGVLKDSKVKGCYEKSDIVNITNPNLVSLLVESALYAMPEAKGSLSLLLNNPAFFPFRLPAITGDYISQDNNRIDVLRHGLDEEMLTLKTAKSVVLQFKKTTEQ